MTKKKLPKEVRLCAEKCGAKCCKYATVKIDAPRTKCDFDEIRWFLAHDDVSVIIESRLWYLQFDTRCEFLSRSNLCSNYENRFELCREYAMDNCEDSDAEPPIVFSRTEEFDKFIEKRQRSRKRRATDKRKRKKRAR
jgi:Fe-S-cluster containining protein